MRVLVEKTSENPTLLDASELVRPEIETTKEKKFRVFDNEEHPLHARVKKTYKDMHTYQTVDFVKRKRSQWLNFDHLEATIMEALFMLNDLVDESDPDLDLPNIIHAFQTAERIRAKHPELEWFQFVGLIHDLGKIMAFYGEPQWAVVGDTFPVGCEFQKDIVYRESSFEDNPDLENKLYSSPNGMYEPNCGLDKVLMSWGHDEYLYQVLKHNNCSVPEEGFYIIRYHSFYPWHSHNNYQNLTDEADREMLKWVQEFNKFDLYTKSTELPDVEALTSYYQKLVDKFCPGVVKF